MSRIPKATCAACHGKRSYHTEGEAREALGRVVVGNWHGTPRNQYALGVYKGTCGHWHIGHNRRVIRVIERMMKNGNSKAAQ